MSKIFSDIAIKEILKELFYYVSEQIDDAPIQVFNEFVEKYLQKYEYKDENIIFDNNSDVLTNHFVEWLLTKLEVKHVLKDLDKISNNNIITIYRAIALHSNELWKLEEKSSSPKELGYFWTLSEHKAQVYWNEEGDYTHMDVEKACGKQIYLLSSRITPHDIDYSITFLERLLFVLENIVYLNSATELNLIKIERINE